MPGIKVKALTIERAADKFDSWYELIADLIKKYRKHLAKEEGLGQM